MKIFENSSGTTSDNDENTKWNEFVESIKSKLTVKQVVDGVRSGGSLTFDYLLLIVTAEWVKLFIKAIQGDSFIINFLMF